MLCDWACSSRPTRLLQTAVSIHDAVDARFLRDALCPSLRTGHCRRGDVGSPSAIPYATDVVSWDDLRETTGLDVSDLDEPCVEQENIGRVPRDMFCCAFPLDGSHAPTRITVTIDIEAELCHSVSHVNRLVETILTVITQQKFVLVGPEHTHRAAGLASFRQFFETRVVALRNCDTLETTSRMCESMAYIHRTRTYSVKSMISKPFVQRMTILAFRKMRSNDSDGRKKSCDTCQSPHGENDVMTYPVDSEPLRALRPQTKARTEGARRLCSLIDLPYNRL